MARPAPPQPEGFHYALLGLQAADGSFNWDERAEGQLQHVSHDPQRWRATVEGKLPPLAAGASREAVVHTVLVLLLLAVGYPGQEPVWRRAYRKACAQFLASAFGKDAGAVEEWLKQLRSALAA